MEIPVEEIQKGDRLDLLNGQEVIVQGISKYGDELVVRWRTGGKFPRGHRLEGKPALLGSLKPCRPGQTVSIGGRTPAPLEAV